MPGIRKTDLVKRLESMLHVSNAVVHDSCLAKHGRLPWTVEVEFPNRIRRRYRCYVWTVGHGGKTRSPNEYRIQTKLDANPEFAFGESATTILLGYYHSEFDKSGRAVGNLPPKDMEVLVTWDPLKHFKLGASSSCQVPYSLLESSHFAGVAQRERRLSHGDTENVIAMKPEYLSPYLAVASGGHQFASIEAIESFRFAVG